MIRHCPNCDAVLKSGDHFFCTSCGTELPSNLIVADKSFHRVSHLRVPAPVTSERRSMRDILVSVLRKVRERKDSLIALGLIIFLVVFSISMVLILKARSERTTLSSTFPTSVATSASKPVAVDSGPTASSGTISSGSASEILLKSDAIAQYIPADVDIYIETTNRARVKHLLSETDARYSLLLNSLDPFITAHSGVIITNIEGTPVTSVVLFLYAEDFDATTIDLAGYEWLQLHREGLALLLSTDPDVIPAMLAAKEGLAKNMVKSAQYVTFMHADTVSSGDTLFYSSSPTTKLALTELLGDISDMMLRAIVSTYSEKEDNFVIL
jgi:hypothetical protein